MNNNENTKKIGKVLYAVVIILIIAGLGFMLFKRLTSKKEVVLNPMPSVNVTHIMKGNIAKEISVMGNILPTDTYYVVAKVGGDIKKVHVENGKFVKKGDPICEIDAEKEIEAAFIQYDTAKKNYERMQKLYRAGDISQQSFESVKSQYDGLKLAYDTKVEYSVPVAVADGYVENTNMTENTSINQGTVLCYITSEGAKEINFGVTERVLEGIKINDDVVIEKSGKKYNGYISNISNLIDAQTGLFKVKAVITSDNSFASGIMAKVTFPYIKKNNIYILPNDLIYYESSMPYLYVVGDDNKLKKEYIVVGIENDVYTEILTKLDSSLKIVSTWNKDLAEGVEVNIVKDDKLEVK
jgi:RND family efflux transporter MFP subunit